MALFSVDPFAQAAAAAPRQPAARMNPIVPTVAGGTAPVAPFPTTTPAPTSGVSTVAQPTQNRAATPSVMDPLAFAPSVDTSGLPTSQTSAAPVTAPFQLAPDWYSAPAPPSPTGFQQTLNTLGGQSFTDPLATLLRRT